MFRNGKESGCLHDGPLMRFFGLRGLKVETAGMTGDTATEGNLIGAADVIDSRDVILLQRQNVIGTEETSDAQERQVADSEILVEIRDILKRIEEQGKG